MKLIFIALPQSVGKVKARRIRPRADIVDTGGCGWLLEIVAESDEKLVLLRSLISSSSDRDKTLQECLGVVIFNTNER